MSFIVDWLEKNQSLCPIKERIGFDCLGCGAQTALISLLRGNLIESFLAYPALIPLIILVIIFFIQIIFKSKIAYSILKFWFIFTIIIIVVGYMFKLISL